MAQFPYGKSRIVISVPWSPLCPEDLLKGNFQPAWVGNKPRSWATKSSGSQAVILEGTEIRLGTEGISLLAEYRKCLSRRRMERSHPCQATLTDGSGDIIAPPARHLSTIRALSDELVELLCHLNHQ